MSNVLPNPARCIFIPSFSYGKLTKTWGELDEKIICNSLCCLGMKLYPFDLFAGFVPCWKWSITRLGLLCVDWPDSGSRGPLGVWGQRNQHLWCKPGDEVLCVRLFASFSLCLFSSGWSISTRRRSAERKENLVSRRFLSRAHCRARQPMNLICFENASYCWLMTDAASRHKIA